MDQCQAVFGAKDLITPGITAITALAGILLSSWLTSRQLERRQLNEARLTCYAQWSASMNERMRIYARQLSKPIPDDDFKVIHVKLLMMEPDPTLRALVKGIWTTFPELYTPEFKEMYELTEREPGFVWEPFQAKMDELVEKVHGSIHG